MRKSRKTFSLNAKKAEFVAKIALGQLKDFDEDELNTIALDLDIDDENKSSRKVALEIIQLVF